MRSRVVRRLQREAIMYSVANQTKRLSPCNGTVRFARGKIRYVQHVVLKELCKEERLVAPVGCHRGVAQLQHAGGAQRRRL